jgi:HSP20 family protein
MDPFDLFRTSPFAMMRRFMEDMEQQWASFGTGRGGQGISATGGTSFAPPMEMFERDGNLVVRADLPGLTKDDVQVEVTEESLTITGERRSEHEGQQGGVFRSERHYGTFHRRIPLPEGVNAEQVRATFQDGVLEVTMPAPQQQARSRRIEVRSGATSVSGTPSGAEHHESNPANREPAPTAGSGA